jgi:hypothetical protein
MKLHKIFLINSVILVLTLLIINSSFSQVKKGRTISFSGVIENISSDLQFIVVNETRISIDSGTQIVNEKGNIGGVYDLKPKSYIAIEVLQNSNGLLAKKIILNTPKRNP